MASLPTRLLGPPEIRSSISSSTAATATGEPFIDLMDVGFNGACHPPLGLTENFSPTFLSSGNPCLDFFFQVVPGTSVGTVTALLSSAWDHDPLTALKLICHLRGVRGTGKSDREGFYSAALWLHRHHPKTLALDIGLISEFGYMKDLPEILYRIINKGSREERLAAELAKVKVRVEEARNLRRKKRSDMAIRAVNRYARDPDYRFLHDRISDYFAGLLSSDLSHLQSGHLNKISLAAKWCPSLDCSYDRSTLLCEAIARQIFPRNSDPEYASLLEEHYAYRVRDRLRRSVLVPLRRALELPEVYMSAGLWDSLPYPRVASVAMKNYKKLFLKHDLDRFSKFLNRVREGKAKIAAGALLPHEILSSACSGVEDDEVAELQWRRMVKDLSDRGRLSNCIAVCDVSGSMSGTPMDVAVALGLLISELSEEPWKGTVITFSKNPQLHKIVGNSIKEKTEFIRRMEWGMNTDFQRVFDRILRVAAEGRLEEEKMVKRVFVFSDMEFDQASANSWETDYEAICRKFREGGYGSAVPEVVFWNLRDSRSTPVPSTQKRVAMVSGFSKNLVKLFLEGDGVLSPVAVLEAAISGEEYQKLVVFD